MPSVYVIEPEHRIFTVEIPAPGLTPDHACVAGICEVGPGGKPKRGNAGMKIYNVVPEYGRVWVRGEVDWNAPLPVRITVVWSPPILYP